MTSWERNTASKQYTLVVVGRENQVKGSALGNRGERGEDLSCKLPGTGFIKGII